MTNIDKYQYSIDTDKSEKPEEIYNDKNELRNHIEYFSKNFLTGNGNHFSVKKDRCANKLVLHASFPGAYFLNTLLNPLVVNKIVRHQNEKNPYVQIMLKNIELSKLEYFPLLLNHISGIKLKKWVILLNKCVAKIIYALNTPSIQKKLTTLKKQESVNYAVLISHIKGAYQGSSFALLTASYLSHDYRPDVPSFSDNPHVSYRDVLDIIEANIKYFQSASWSHVYIDCAWKINYFYRDRYSFDLLILLDETKISSDGLIAENVSNYWHEKTSGIGRFTGSSFRGNVVTPNGDSFCSDEWLISVAKGMTSLTHSVVEMANEKGVTQGIGSLTFTT